MVQGKIERTSKLSLNIVCCFIKHRAGNRKGGKGKGKMVDRMAEIINYFKQGIASFCLHEGIWHYVAIFLLIVIAVMVSKGFLTRAFCRLAVRLFPNAREEITDIYFPAFEKPLAALLLFLGGYGAITYFPLNLEQGTTVARLFRTSLIIIAAWGFYNLTAAYSSFLKIFIRKLNSDFDEILSPLLSRVLRFIIIVMAIVMVAGEWGYDVNGFIAGLGLGGLAVALAAKDAIANILGGIVILLDKPFSVGDWVSTSQTEGTVEEISFRSTKVRTFDQALVTVPNQILANEAIVNWTRMGKRRVKFKLKVAHTTPGDRLKKCVGEIRKMLEEHPEIHEESIYVTFENFCKGSLDIGISYFTLETGRGKYLSIKEDVNLRIMEILEREGVSTALPIRNVYFEKGVPHKTRDDYNI